MSVTKICRKCNVEKPEPGFRKQRRSCRECEAKEARRYRKEDMPELYSVWAGMIQRCENKNDKKYPRYGGRGISVCERWRNDFKAFESDMGNRPPRLTIDRINNDGNYEPGNCRWATNKEQARNRNNNITINHNGVEKCSAEWSRLLGMGKHAVRKRLNRGWCKTCSVTKPKFGICDHRS